MTRLAAACQSFILFCLPADAFETKAAAAYVVDHTTGTVLLSKNADTPLPPASMSKLMTLYMAFEAISGVHAPATFDDVRSPIWRTGD